MKNIFLFIALCAAIALLGTCLFVNQAAIAQAPTAPEMVPQSIENSSDASTQIETLRGTLVLVPQTKSVEAFCGLSGDKDYGLRRKNMPILVLDFSDLQGNVEKYINKTVIIKGEIYTKPVEPIDDMMQRPLTPMPDGSWSATEPYPCEIFKVSSISFPKK